MCVFVELLILRGTVLPGPRVYNKNLPGTRYQVYIYLFLPTTNVLGLIYYGPPVIVPCLPCFRFFSKIIVSDCVDIYFTNKICFFPIFFKGFS